ncbi:MAG: hypothetical protein HY662_01055 [Chloroflexi bacterium]|nr:hypothetical protein [Chloroflexota bacterium]
MAGDIVFHLTLLTIKHKNGIDSPPRHDNISTYFLPFILKASTFGVSTSFEEPLTSTVVL